MILKTAGCAKLPSETVESICSKMEEIRHMCLLSAAIDEQDDKAVELMRGLWLGGKKDALDMAWQTDVGIGAILNMASDDFDPPEGGYPDGMKMSRIPAEDAEYALIPGHLPEAFEFVKTCLSEVPIQPILLHCMQGLNRSGAIAVACVMLLQRLPLLDAYFLVSRVRCDVVNNPHFQEQLITLAHCNDLLCPAHEVEKALERHAWLTQRFFSVLAGGPRLTTTTFLDGLKLVVPELDASDVVELQERLAWFRDDGGEGIDGMSARDVSCWLAADSKARSCLLHPLVKHIGLENNSKHQK